MVALLQFSRHLASAVCRCFNVYLPSLCELIFSRFSRVGSSYSVISYNSSSLTSSISALQEHDSSKTVMKYFAKRSGKSSAGRSKMPLRMCVNALISAFADSLITISFFSTSRMTSWRKIRLSTLSARSELLVSTYICSLTSWVEATELKERSNMADDTSVI